MFRPVTLSFSVPMLVPNPEQIIDFYAAWSTLWLSLWRPMTHEVIEFPITLATLPERPEVDLDRLPKGVVRFK